MKTQAYTPSEALAQFLEGKNIVEIADNCAAAQMPLLGHLCGYTIFPLEAVPVPFRDYTNDAIKNTSPHGGVTLAEVFTANDGSEWMVYGFDCAHAGDESRKYSPQQVAWWALIMRERIKSNLTKIKQYEAYNVKINTALAMVERYKEERANLFD